ncbi:radical SAM protein [Nocardia arthritidis]|uniref:Radical SAM protein n=1 Tax=Nocardia arthritidis TaxID=228602 RepID=A0A6G9YGQ0_9NOCA|nr:radical SAM protein [Nocardia arthritidis]QIS12409.1 radical SAM protein [Nocardia arthritidis]
MIAADGPVGIIWDITYACPLRCMHCYSESGRRPAMHPTRDRLLRMTDAFISLHPTEIAIAGGEPLLVDGLSEVAERFSAAGIAVILYTSGALVDPPKAEQLLRQFRTVAVSLDGATAEVHDRIRGRRPAFERAMAALEFLDRASRRLKTDGASPATIGIEVSIMRSNLAQVEDFCTAIAPRFPELAHLVYTITMPAGLANRAGFVEHELLDDAESRRLTSPEYLERLRDLAPAGLDIRVEDHWRDMIHPDDVAAGRIMPIMHVRPDGGVHAMPIYEGTVGSILEEPPMTLWRRAVDRWTDPFVVRTLAPVRTTRDWAAAARRIDYHFGDAADRARIDRRPVFPAQPHLRTPLR